MTSAKSCFSSSLSLLKTPTIFFISFFSLVYSKRTITRLALYKRKNAIRLKYTFFFILFKSAWKSKIRRFRASTFGSWHEWCDCSCRDAGREGPFTREDQSLSRVRLRVNFFLKSSNRTRRRRKASQLRNKDKDVEMETRLSRAISICFLNSNSKRFALHSARILETFLASVSRSQLIFSSLINLSTRSDRMNLCYWKMLLTTLFFSIESDIQ